MVAFILGLLFITIVIFLRIYYINILKKGKYTIGKICGISNGTIYHIGAAAYFIEVHIYYNPNNQRQVLLKEYMWKEFLLCAFLLFLGIMLISVGIYILGTGNL